MYLFILLFTVYLIVTLTHSEYMSATGLRFVFFLFLFGISARAYKMDVFTFSPESVALNTCVSEMRLIKFDE